MQNPLFVSRYSVSHRRRKKENSFITKLVAITAIISAVLITVAVVLISSMPKGEVLKALNPENEPKEEVNKPCYKWREILFQPLDSDLESKTNLSTPNGLSGVGVGFGEDGVQNSLSKFEPSSSSPKSLDDVVGLDECIEDIREFILYPLEHPIEAKQREEDYGIKIPSFSVFFGPPGCGKTMLAEAIAAESGCDMYILDLSQVGSTYVNGTVINIAKAFKEIEDIAKKSELQVNFLH